MPAPAPSSRPARAGWSTAHGWRSRRRGWSCCCSARSRRRSTCTTRPVVRCCWSSAPWCARSRTTSCCASDGCRNRSGCSDERRLRSESNGHAKPLCWPTACGRTERSEGRPVNGTWLTGAGLGLAAATGVLLAVRAAPPMRPVRLSDRVAPYLADTAPPSRLLARPTATSAPFTVARRLFGPVLAELVTALDRLIGGAASVRRRLRGLGSATTVEEFRIEQVL